MGVTVRATLQSMKMKDSTKQQCHSEYVLGWGSKEGGVGGLRDNYGKVGYQPIKALKTREIEVQGFRECVPPLGCRTRGTSPMRGRIVAMGIDAKRSFVL